MPCPALRSELAAGVARQQGPGGGAVAPAGRRLLCTHLHIVVSLVDAANVDEQGAQLQWAVNRIRAALLVACLCRWLQCQ